MQNSFYAESLFEVPDVDIDMPLWQKLVESLAKVFSAPTVAINQANKNGIQVLCTNSDNGDKNSIQGCEGAIFPVEINTYCLNVVESRKSLYVQDAKKEGIWEDNPDYTEFGLRSYLGVPLEWPDGRIFGTLCVCDQKETDYNATFQSLLFDYKDIIDYQLRIIEKSRQLMSLSSIDELTGLFNRRGGLAASDNLVSIAQRTNKQIAMIFLDMDDLKPINDNYGHQVGDAALKQFAQNIKTVIRTHDVVARIGGDEFFSVCLIDQASDLDKIIARINDINQEGRFSVDKDKEIKLQASIGASIGSPSGIKELEVLLEQADKKMYVEKRRKKMALQSIRSA